MEFIVSEHQLDKLLEDIGPFKENYLMKIFAFLNEEKKKVKTKKELLKRIESISSHLNLPPEHSLYLFELYLLNYRKDGDYSSLTKENFVDPRMGKGRFTPNTSSWKFTATLLPFRASNLSGFWSKDGKGVPIYIVESYDWYPLYIFRDGIWYQTTKRYSPSTGRQMSNANPIKWEENLDDKVYLLTPEEMKMLRDNGLSHRELMKTKLKSLETAKEDIISKKKRTLKPYTGWHGPTSVNIKFKVSSVDFEGDKAIIGVDIIDVTKRGGDLNTGNYLKGDFPGITPEYVEDKITQKLKENLYDYLGPRIRYQGPLRDTHNIRLKFNHVKK